MTDGCRHDIDTTGAKLDELVSRRLIQLYETMPSEELLRLATAFQLDMANGADQAFVLDRLATIVIVLTSRGRPCIVCRRCGRLSFNANDVREGYCGGCHDWTR